MHDHSIRAGLVCAVLAFGGDAMAVELGKMAPADLARLQARTICSCVFVQRLPLGRCTDGRSAIWRYPSAEAAPAFPTGAGERLEVTRERAAGTVRILAGGRVLARSRYLADGGGCVTLPTDTEASPSVGFEAPEQPSAVDAGAVSTPLPRGTLPSGVDAALIRAALDEGFSVSGPLRGVARAVVVVADGRVVADRYAPQFGPWNLYYVGSIAKVFGNLLAGLAAADGKLEVREKVDLPEWRRAGDERRRITFDQLLKMTSGLAWDEEFWVPGDPGYEVFFGGPAGLDVYGYMAARPLEAQPGTHFEYSTGAASLLSAAVQRKAGLESREALLAYFREKLFAPLGATQVVTELDRKGTFLSGHGVFIGAEELARIGMLLQRDGVWEGRRLLPEGWVAYSTRPALQGAPGYGAQLQLDIAGVSGCFGHSGVGENRLLVCPERGVVVVWLSSAFDFTGALELDASARLAGQIANAFPTRGR